jgi:hypothetical protein
VQLQIVQMYHVHMFMTITSQLLVPVCCCLLASGQHPCGWASVRQDMAVWCWRSRGAFSLALQASVPSLSCCIMLCHAVVPKAD